jgi:hypothetical protein
VSLRLVSNGDAYPRPSRVFAPIAGNRQFTPAEANTQTSNYVFRRDDGVAADRDILRGRRITNAGASRLRARRARNDVVVHDGNVGPQSEVNIVLAAGRLVQNIFGNDRALSCGPSQRNPESRSVVNDVVGHHHIADSRVSVGSEAHKIPAGILRTVVHDLDPQRRTHRHVSRIA